MKEKYLRWLFIDIFSKLFEFILPVNKGRVLFVSQIIFIHGLIIIPYLFFCKGSGPKPIHGQPDAVLLELHLKSLLKKQSFTKKRKTRKGRGKGAKAQTLWIDKLELIE
jgi:hypothetical protein